MVKILNTLPKRTNAFDGAKAHNDFNFIKVGRVEYNSWLTDCLQVGDVIISEREIIHIANEHKAELLQLGMDAEAYVKMIISLCDEVRDDGRGAYYFILSGSRTHKKSKEQVAVVELEEAWFDEKRVYIIKTARPMYWYRLQNYELLCVNPRT